VGKTSGMKIVEVTRPPVITTARGRSISVPCMRNRRMGNSPQTAVDAVMSFGRTRPMLASRIASRKGLPSAMSARVRVTSTKPFCTAIPKSPINPTSDDTFHVSPVSRSATILPTNAFVARRLAGEAMAELCREFGISRKTGYKIFVHLTLKKEATNRRQTISFNSRLASTSSSMSSSRIYQGLPDIDYPFHDRTIVVTHCGRICLGKKKINFSTVFAGQAVGIKEVQDDIWLVS
jgi:hypothetical protein